MHTKRRIAVGFVVIVICVCLCVVWKLNKNVGYYQYPSMEDSLDAATLLNNCRIPDKTLKKMTDEQLAQAVADFPLLIDVYAYSSDEAGVEVLAKESDAYRELLTRRNAKEALMGKVKELEKDSPDSIAIEILETIILNEKSFQDIDE